MSMDQFENKFKELKKEEANTTPWSLLTKLVSIGIIILLGAVIYRTIYPIIKNPKETNNEEKIVEDTKSNNIKILSIKNNKILVYKKDNTSKRIEFIDIASNQQPIDITQSDMDTDKVILANNGIDIIYSSNLKNHTNLYMITVKNNSPITRIFDSKNITYNFNTPCDKKKDDYLKICKWSTLEWSPDNHKVLFFTCSTNMSFLTIVDTNNLVKPKIIRDSIVCNNSEREHRWLKNEKIIFSSGNNLYSIFPHSNQSSKLIYGNISK